MKESNCFLCSLPPIPLLPSRSTDGSMLAAAMRSTNVNSRYLILTWAISWWLPSLKNTFLHLASRTPLSHCFPPISLALLSLCLSGLTVACPGPLLYLQSVLIPLVISSNLMTLNAIYILRTPKFISLAETFPLNKLNLYIQLTSTWMPGRYAKKMSKAELPISPCTISPQKSVLQVIFPIFINDNFVLPAARLKRLEVFVFLSCHNQVICKILSTVLSRYI